jgi:hypothetical protein
MSNEFTVPAVVGITGKIGSGKTTVSNYIKQYYNMNEYSFAEPLKKIGECFKFQNKELYGTQEEKLAPSVNWGISGRVFLQRMGTEIGREILPKIIPEMDMGDSGSIWIRLFDIHADEVSKSDKPGLVISDIRFLNEASAIKSRGGIVIRIIRDDEKESGGHTTHASEMEMDQIKPDFIIHNSGNLDNLYNTVNNIMSHRDDLL